MMNRQFNQQFKCIFNKIPLKRLLICIAPIFFMAFSYPTLQNKYILKIDKKIFQGITKSYIAIGQRIVSDFPCGEAIGIALQDAARYIFSSASLFNATLVPGSNHEILIPDDGPNKTFQKDLMSYVESFNRINNLKIGIIEGYYGQRWAIDAEQLRQNYATNAFDIQLEGKTETAFDHSNMFFEMLISIQHLSKENELLKDRLTSIEEKLNLQEGPRTLNDSNKTSHIKIVPNPVTKDQIIINYQFKDDVKNAKLMITDMSGRTMQVYKLSMANTSQVEEISLSSGVYLYHLVYDGQKTEGQKLIIQ